MPFEGTSSHPEFSKLIHLTYCQTGRSGSAGPDSVCTVELEIIMCFHRPSSGSSPRIDRVLVRQIWSDAQGKTGWDMSLEIPQFHEGVARRDQFHTGN